MEDRSGSVIFATAQIQVSSLLLSRECRADDACSLAVVLLASGQLRQSNGPRIPSRTAMRHRRLCRPQSVLGDEPFLSPRLVRSLHRIRRPLGLAKRSRRRSCNRRNGIRSTLDPRSDRTCKGEKGESVDTSRRSVASSAVTYRPGIRDRCFMERCAVWNALYRLSGNQGGAVWA